jgi:aerobic carbon-monoxide dehydrogenase medium subunit
MKPPPFRYFDPDTLDEALALVAEQDNAKLLAGGQSLMPMLNMRFVQPDALIDLNRIGELAHIRAEGELIRIGAMTRQRDLELCDLVRARCPLMHEALTMVGHRQTRNRGTIGGSLCHLDPAAELVTVATAHEAIVEVASRRGRRDVPMSNFPAFFMTPAIEPDEIVTGLRFTAWPQRHGSAFVEFARRRGDFALASVAVLLVLTGDHVARASITVGGLTHAPSRIAAAEQMLVGAIPTPELIRAAAAACGELEATSDVHASAGYRRQLARTLAEGAIGLAQARAGP